MAIDPDATQLISEMIDQFNIDNWRAKVAKDPVTKRWAHIFNKIEPSIVVAEIAANIIHNTSVKIQPLFAWTIALADWTYGYAQALTDLADENIILWEGQPSPIFCVLTCSYKHISPTGGEERLHSPLPLR